MVPRIFHYKVIKRLKFSFRVRIICLVVCSIIFVSLYQYISSWTCAKMISLEEIPNYLVPAITKSELLLFEEKGDRKLCDLFTEVTNGTWPISSMNVTDTYIEEIIEHNKIQPGGMWEPSECISQHHVAIVVPYRDRQIQLNTFLVHMHPFLQFQRLKYQIFIIEQTHQRPFNRAKLFNVGFKESQKISPFHCYIFHDVDLLPLNVHNIYGCCESPRHLSAYIDIFDYKIPYDWIFGGAVSISKDQFIYANGFSNKFYGWGGEDDDFFNRVTRNGTICRFESDVSRYVMLSHKKEKPNEDRYYYLSTGVRRFESDGLNSLRYTVKKSELRPLYTRILVDL